MFRDILNSIGSWLDFVFYFLIFYFIENKLSLCEFCNVIKVVGVIIIGYCVNRLVVMIVKYYRFDYFSFMFVIIIVFVVVCKDFV